MENASKALIMAGAVLIALLVISLLVFFFHSIRDIQSVNLTSEQVQQATEFNKQYDVYQRDIYGSELLSIANKIADYNQKESETKGYTKVTLEVIISKDIDNTYFTKGTYTDDAINKKIEEIEKAQTNLGNEIIEFIPDGSTRKISRKVSKLATMRTVDIEELGTPTTSNYKEKIVNYNTLKALISEIKAKKFKYVNFEYDKNTGRIQKMSYKL